MRGKILSYHASELSLGGISPDKDHAMFPRDGTLCTATHAKTAAMPHREVGIGTSEARLADHEVTALATSLLLASVHESAIEPLRPPTALDGDHVEGGVVKVRPSNSNASRRPVSFSASPSPVLLSTQSLTSAVTLPYLHSPLAVALIVLLGCMHQRHHRCSYTPSSLYHRYLPITLAAIDVTVTSSLTEQHINNKTTYQHRLSVHPPIRLGVSISCCVAPRVHLPGLAHPPSSIRGSRFY